MRIDIHTYVGHWPYRKLPCETAAALIEQMDAFGVNEAWVGNLNGLFYRNCHVANAELAEQIEPYRSKLIPFAVINPTYAAWQRDLETCVRDFGMRGLRLYPQYHGYELGSRPCMDAIAAATELGLPVAFTVRMMDKRQQSWLDHVQELDMSAIASTIRKARSGRFIILHAFPDRLSDDEVDALGEADLLFDTVYGTGVPVGLLSAYPLAAQVTRWGSNRYAFGSAFPFRDYVSQLLRMELFTEANGTSATPIWSANAAGVLRP